MCLGKPITCGECNEARNILYGNWPYQVKCPYTGEMHWLGEECNIEFAPVKHAKWIEDKPYRDEDGYIVQQFYCSECGRYEDEQEPYCNCGCKMDLED